MLYQVRINCQNLLIMVEGKSHPEKYGFMAVRFVEADIEEEAIQTAFKLLNKDEKVFKRIMNLPEDQPRVYVQEVIEVKSKPEDINDQIGLIWYPMESEDA